MKGVPGIGSIAYRLPANAVDLRSLGRAGLLTSEPEVLEGFGFRQVHVAQEETPYDLAVAASQAVLGAAAIDPASIDMLIYAGVQSATAFVPRPSAADSAAVQRSTVRFRYPAMRLQHELGLTRAQVIGVDQLACTSLLAAVRMARAFCVAEQLERVLCVAADFFPCDAGREAIFNCTSDGAAAVIVERGGSTRPIRSAVQVSKGYYWNPDTLRDETIAAYFPTAKHVIERAVAEAGWRMSDVDWVIPHNVSVRSWDILTALAGLRGARVWSKNIGRVGHTLAGDNFINLADAVDAGDVVAGEKLVLFSFGYGAHWTALAVEA